MLVEDHGWNSASQSTDFSGTAAIRAGGSHDAVADARADVKNSSSINCLQLSTAASQLSRLRSHQKRKIAILWPMCRRFWLHSDGGKEGRRVAHALYVRRRAVATKGDDPADPAMTLKGFGWARRLRTDG